MQPSEPKPIVSLDLETTGLSTSTDRIVSIYLLKTHPDGRKESMDLVLDPGIHIPEETARIHGIDDEKVQGCPRFADKADDILAFIAGCDLSGYNIRFFDLPFLFEEFSRAKKIFRYMDHRIIDSMTIWSKKEPRTLTGAVKRYLGEELIDAHQAKADTEAQARVLEAQLKEYDLTIEEAHALMEQERMVDLSGRFAFDKEGEAVYTFGKNKGKRVKEVDPSYLQWMINEATMPIDSKIFARKFLNSITTTQKA